MSDSSTPSFPTAAMVSPAIPITGLPGGTAQPLDRLWSLGRLLTFGRPHLFVVATALMTFTCSYVIAFLLRFDFSVPRSLVGFMVATLPLALAIKVLGFRWMRVFEIRWAYVGLRDALLILRAAMLTSAALALAVLLVHPSRLIPRSVLILDAVLTFLGIAAFFCLLRTVRERTTFAVQSAKSREPVFIVGAGDAGDMLLREFERKPGSGVRVVAFLDDDAEKIGKRHRGVPILGPIRQAERFACHYGIHRVFVAMPSVPGSQMRKIVADLTDAGLGLRVLPPLNALASAAPYAPQLRDVSIEDLLRRESVHLDMAAISGFLRDKVVLVTGAAGSIGSEICRQVLAFGPARLVALDIAESPLHDLMLDFPERARSGMAVPELVDITDESAVRRVFDTHKPQVVFHAAAVKHVPMLEAHPDRAVKVNIVGTHNVAAAARGCARAFVMISTDKAVRPSSVMGASKRVAERAVRGLASAADGTRYVSVRFGNVLGSNGSVVPIFKRQIAQGGPVTVTHPEMRRYFMTIPEAVQLVLQAATLAEGGEIFVLDMGEQIRIVDLAEDLIRLSGLRPHEDIKIDFTGMRPGEKLFEEWVADSETHAPTVHPQVHRLRSPESGVSLGSLRALTEAAEKGAMGATRGELQALVPDHAFSANS
jgi:FlaA1/EpsC-like NDP-sugar epimerase